MVDDIDKRVRSTATTSEASLDVFSGLFDNLVNQYSPEFDKYRLDEIVVAAMAPTVSEPSVLHFRVLM